MKILSIDIGVNGGIIVYDPDDHRISAIYKVPTTKSRVRRGGKMINRSEYNWEEIAKLPPIWYRRMADVCIMENVHPMPNDGKAQLALLMFGKGMYTGLNAGKREIVFIHPPKWKKHFGLIGEKKGRSTKVMEELIVSGKITVSDDIDEVPLNNGIADAVLMARYYTEEVLNDEKKKNV